MDRPSKPLNIAQPGAPASEASNGGKAEKDRIFASKLGIVSDFQFGLATALVFDDMLQRSVPFYAEIQRMIVEMAADVAQPGSRVYDLGCSTGTSMVLLDKVIPPDCTLVGVDYSSHMLAKTREKLKEHGVTRQVDLQEADLNTGVSVKDASVVVVNLTLQFVRPLYRKELLQTVANGMRDGGCLILIEKVLSRDPRTNRDFIKYYYDFKQRNGYSEMEISQKREALENVLVPYRTEENAELLLSAGFSSCEIFFKWYNFCGYIARKGGQ